MTDVESACKRLIGNLENCVAVLHRLKRYDGSRDAEAASKAIESAYKAIYEVSPVVWGKTEKPTKEVKK